MKNQKLQIFKDSMEDQADKIIKFYSSTRNEFEPISRHDFQDFLDDDKQDGLNEILVDQKKIIGIIKKKINKKALQS